MKTKISSLFILTLVVVLTSCLKDPELTTIQHNELTLPLPNYSYNSSSSNERVALGRVLFYDPKLSVNNTIACASCHKQANAFSDNVKSSIGFNHELTSRNSPPIQNLQNGITFTGQGPASLFWDGRAEMLNSMVLMPVTNHVEMGMADGNDLVNRIKDVSYYQTLFNDAYGNPEVTQSKIAEALATFVGAIQSNTSKFDQVIFSQASFSALEQEGRNLFFTTYQCNRCHPTDNPGGYNTALESAFINIGLDPTSADAGRASFTGNNIDHGKFKVPNLRNVALTAPYMHDGRFNTLDEVLNHYSNNISATSNLDDRLMDQNTGQPIKLNISTHQKEAIIAFLNTLTDNQMTHDAKYSNPFN